MIITYDKSYREILKGADWTLYSDVKVFKDTLIVQHLQDFVEDNQNVPFDEMEALLEREYRNSRHKSRCSIHKYDSHINVCGTSGSFPRFYILKNEA